MAPTSVSRIEGVDAVELLAIDLAEKLHTVYKMELGMRGKPQKSKRDANWEFNERHGPKEEQTTTPTPKGKTTYCAECGEVQFASPSGVTCRNGHGGAESLDKRPRVRVAPSKRVFLKG